MILYLGDCMGIAPMTGVGVYVVGQYGEMTGFAVRLGERVSPEKQQNRFNYGRQKLRDAGIAALSEANGQLTQWFALADARLYQMKSHHHQTG